MKGIYLMIFFCSAQIMDVLSTYFAVRALGFREMNPVVASLFYRFGMADAFAIKLFLSLLLVFCYFYAAKKKNYFHWPLEKSLQITGVSTWLVALWNVTGILLFKVLLII